MEGFNKKGDSSTFFSLKWIKNKKTKKCLPRSEGGLTQEKKVGLNLFMFS